MNLLTAPIGSIGLPISSVLFVCTAGTVIAPVLLVIERGSSLETGLPISEPIASELKARLAPMLEPFSVVV